VERNESFSVCDGCNKRQKLVFVNVLAF
jgi:hypothetical protein